MTASVELGKINSKTPQSLKGTLLSHNKAFLVNLFVCFDLKTPQLCLFRAVTTAAVDSPFAFLGERVKLYLFRAVTTAAVDSPSAFLGERVELYLLSLIHI